MLSSEHCTERETRRALGELMPGARRRNPSSERHEQQVQTRHTSCVLVPSGWLSCPSSEHRKQRVRTKHIPRESKPGVQRRSPSSKHRTPRARPPIPRLRPHNPHPPTHQHLGWAWESLWSWPHYKPPGRGGRIEQGKRMQLS
jgi:hypothetical protein